MPLSVERFVEQLADSGILASDTVRAFLPPQRHPKDAKELARELIRQKKLTKFQAEEVYKGQGKSLVLGNYTILDQIGAGGMGQVFKAEHRRMKRVVAVKMLPVSLMKDPAVVARFEREVTAAAKLNHPNIVTAFDADNVNGVHLLVMEYVDGDDLSALVKGRGPLSAERASDYILQAARGLEAAHAEGIVHRDIKPANLLLDPKGTVKILDLGLARLRPEAGGGQQAELTNTGTVMGTVDFMSPEQALDTKAADARADIYSLGCSLFYLLTGQAMYQGDTLMKKLLAHREQPVPSIRALRPDVPAEIEAVFQKMVAKRPEDRYQSAKELIGDLERCRSGLAPLIEPPPALSSPIDDGLMSFLRDTSAGSVTHRTTSKGEPKPRKRNDGLVIAGVASGVLLLALVAVFFLARTKDEAAPTGHIATMAKSEPRSPKNAEEQPFVHSGETGPPLTEAALVTSPVRLPGVKSWTILPAALRLSMDHMNCTLAANPQAGLLAVANRDGGTRIFETTGKLVKVLVAAGPAMIVAWSRDGKLLAIGEHDRVSLWEYASGRRLGTISLRAAYLAWSPGRPVLAVASAGNVSLFDEKGKPCRPDFSAPALTDMSWAPDGERLAVAEFPGTIEVRQTLTGAVVASWSVSERPGRASIAWSNRGDRLAAARMDEPVRIWNAATGKLLPTLHDTTPKQMRSAPVHVAWSPDGDELAVVYYEGELIAVQTYSGAAETHSRVFYLGSQAPSKAIGWSHDARLLFVQQEAGTVFIHDPLPPGKTFTIDHTWGTFGAVLSENATSIAWMSKGATSTDWGGYRVLAAGLDRDWQLGSQFPEQEYLGASAAFSGSPTKPLLAVAGASLHLLDRGGIVARMELPRPARCLASAPDGGRIALGLDKEVAIVDTAKMQIERTLLEHSAPVSVIAWNRQGRLAAGYEDGALRIWNADLSDFVVATPYGSGSGPAKRIAWSPDGRSIGIVRRFGGQELALVDAADGRVAAQVRAGENFGDMAWIDDSSIVARTATALTRWPLANLAAAERLFQAPCDPGEALLSADGRMAVDADSGADRRFRDGQTGRPLASLVMLRGCNPVIISPEGHYSAPVDVDRELVYVVETDAGEQQTFTPARFAKRFQWKNDPNRAFPLRFDTERGADSAE